MSDKLWYNMPYLLQFLTWILIWSVRAGPSLLREPSRMWQGKASSWCPSEALMMGCTPRTRKWAGLTSLVLHMNSFYFVLQDVLNKTFISSCFPLRLLECKDEHKMQERSWDLIRRKEAGIRTSRAHTVLSSLSHPHPRTEIILQPNIHHI